MNQPPQTLFRGLRLCGKARERHKLGVELFDEFGRTVLPNALAVRKLVETINRSVDPTKYPERVLKASDLNSLRVVDATLRYMYEPFRQTEEGSAFVTELAREFSSSKRDRLLQEFLRHFPPDTPLDDEQIDAWLRDEDLASATLDEFLFVRLLNFNPAAAIFRDLFDDAQMLRQLRSEKSFHRLVKKLDASQDKTCCPVLGVPILDLLQAPINAAPSDLDRQVEWILDHWASHLPPELIEELLRSRDLAREERVFRGGLGRQVAQPYEYRSADYDQERFSDDSEWMPRVVLLARNAYVWLSQLSKGFQQDISRLDQIPDASLEELQRRGITGLWLIGIWERSKASQEIKRRSGSPDAVSSAYSLYDYQVADDLGGEAAFAELKERAWRYGIRLAADMVPNHMGITSCWLFEHPEDFLQLPYSPFPGYRFEGPDICEDPRYTIQIEDGYYDQTDAAVVFRCIDHQRDQTRYIYHGNDGTSMPWNDTAQLNYLKAEVRERVIQTIIEVAKRAPIIRFDAAMTLVKRHVQRLWFPAPGTGGAIPSRSEYGMNQTDFDQALPVEFWAEVVERINKEAPDTLLLAEAFWMMEGYFVRSLGMHRVYNSAFMNMLRDEDNQGYRKLMKNTLEFDPRILQRFVNFMNNPDEDTAADQFGTSDKYFGICTMMATMPGLPMVGHGQCEGLREKYGMDFRTPRLQESVDEALLQEHRRRIFPLFQRRGLFAGADKFRLFDARNEHGIDEHVFAFVNGDGAHRAMVVYHNRFAETAVWVKDSVAFRDGEDLRTEDLFTSLGLSDPGRIVRFRDLVTGRWYLRSSTEIMERGLFFLLKGYESVVLLDFAELADPDGRWRATMERLGGRPAADLEREVRWTRFGVIYENLLSYLASGDLASRQRFLHEAALNLGLNVDEAVPAPILTGRTARAVEVILALAGQSNRSLDVVEDLYLSDALQDEIGLIRALLSLRKIEGESLQRRVSRWFADIAFGQYVGVHTYKQVVYFSKERFESWLEAVDIEPQDRLHLVSLAMTAGYEVEKFLDAVQSS